MSRSNKKLVKSVEAIAIFLVLKQMFSIKGDGKMD